MSLTIGPKYNPITFNLGMSFTSFRYYRWVHDELLLFIQLKLNNDIEVFFPVIPLLTSIVLVSIYSKVGE